jgi:hypothetical protein
MKQSFRRTASAVVLSTVIAAGSLLGTGTASAATYVGDLSQFGHLKPYCEKVPFSYINAKWAVSASPDSATNPYTWRCRVYAMTTGIDMNGVCRYYYGNSYAVATNKGWAWNSWKCYR